MQSPQIGTAGLDADDGVFTVAPVARLVKGRRRADDLLSLDVERSDVA
jgi:hypothetical protein